MDIGLDLQRAYDDGYKKGWEEAEAYVFHCGDETPITNADRIRSMTDEELAEWYWWMLKYLRGFTDSVAALRAWLKEEDK